MSSFSVFRNVGFIDTAPATARIQYNDDDDHAIDSRKVSMGVPVKFANELSRNNQKPDPEKIYFTSPESQRSQDKARVKGTDYLRPVTSDFTPEGKEAMDYSNTHNAHIYYHDRSKNMQDMVNDGGPPETILQKNTLVEQGAPVWRRDVTGEIQNDNVIYSFEDVMFTEGIERHGATAPPPRPDDLRNTLSWRQPLSKNYTNDATRAMGTGHSFPRVHPRAELVGFLDLHVDHGETTRINKPDYNNVETIDHPDHLSEIEHRKKEHEMVHKHV